MSTPCSCRSGLRHPVFRRGRLTSIAEQDTARRSAKKRSVRMAETVRDQAEPKPILWRDDPDDRYTDPVVSAVAFAQRLQAGLEPGALVRLAGGAIRIEAAFIDAGSQKCVALQVERHAVVST